MQIVSCILCDLIPPDDRFGDICLLERAERLDLPAYKGFLNPKMSLVRSEEGEVVDVDVDYSETYTEQMMRYSRDYAAL